MSVHHRATALALSLLAFTCGGCGERQLTLPAEGPLEIELTGIEYEWHARYPGPDGVFDTRDDRITIGEVHAPHRTDVTLILHSDDYIYRLVLPHLDLQEIAVPDLEFSLSFRTDRLGTFEMLGDQMCGYQHDSLLTSLVVVERDVFLDWLSELPRGSS